MKREVAEHFGLRDKYVVKQLLACKCRKEEKIKVGIMPRPQGRLRKDSPPQKVETDGSATP